MPHPFLAKVLIVTGSVAFSAIGAYRDTHSTRLSLASGNVEIGAGSKMANGFTAGFSGVCVASLLKRFTPAQSAVMCGGSVVYGVSRNIAANHNYKITPNAK
jgi:hypothetical protein